MADSPPIKIQVEATSGRIVQTSGSFGMGDAQMELSTIFSDFRTVGDTVFPFRFVNYAGDEKIAETSIREYQLNPVLPADTFRIPNIAATLQ